MRALAANSQEAAIISVVLAVIAGMLFGRWLGAQPKLATQPVRVGDLRRGMAGRR